MEYSPQVATSSTDIKNIPVTVESQVPLVFTRARHRSLLPAT